MCFNKKTIMVISVLILAAFVFVACNKAPDGVVAKVNGEDITEEEFNEYFEEEKAIIEQQYGPDIMTQKVSEDKTFEDIIKENVVDFLVNQKLILDDADAKKITVTDDELDEVLNTFREQYGGEEKFEELLSQSDITIDEFKDDLRHKIISEKHFEDFIKNLDLSDEEAKEYFNENKDSFIKVKASHILVEEKEEGEKILKKLEDGEDFSKIAEKESIDENSAQNGGNLGYFTKGQMVEEFEEMAFSLELGEISNLVETEHGYHIIKVEDKVEDFEDLKDEILESLTNKKYGEYIVELRDEGNVEINI